MRRISVRIGLPLLVLTLLAAPAAAEIYHVKLHNGEVLDTLYQPQPASWDASVLLLLSDAGNWIGVNQKDVDSIGTESQIRGFGIAINTTTVAIGWAPNDLADPQAQGGQSGTTSAQQSAYQVLQKIYQDQQRQDHYSIQQGVQTEQAQGVPPGLIYRPVPQMPPALAPAPVPLVPPPGL